MHPAGNIYIMCVCVCVCSCPAKIYMIWIES